MPNATGHPAKSLHEGRFLSLREIDDWQFATRPNATGVVGVFATTTEGQVILIEQFRHPIQKRVLEICAGLVGDEEEFSDESLADCARRELIEETGYTAGSMKPLLTSPTSAGMTDEYTHLFLAENCVKTHPGGGVAGEDITTHLVTLSELPAFLTNASSTEIDIDFKIHACLGAISVQKTV